MKLSQNPPIFENDRCEDRRDSPYGWVSVWGISFFFHVLLFLILAMMASSIPAGTPGEDRTVNMGIALKYRDGEETVYEAAEDAGTAGDSDSEGDSSEDFPAGAPTDFSQAGAGAGLASFWDGEAEPEIPNVSSQLPGLLPRAGKGEGLIGGGDGVAGVGKLPGGTFGGFGHGKVGYMGTHGTGRSFSYVLDRSGSMEGTPLKAAKSALIQSLQEIQSNQQFQIIFYNDRIHPLGRRQLATEKNRREAAAAVATITADGGTNHMAALKLALETRTDVIFFLTDADEPPMTAAELEFIRRNAPGVQINAIQFGIGPKSNSTPNFLEKLATQNSGQYKYVDVTKLR